MAMTKCSPGRARAEVFILLPPLRGPEKGDPRVLRVVSIPNVRRLPVGSVVPGRLEEQVPVGRVSSGSGSVSPAPKFSSFISKGNALRRWSGICRAGLAPLGFASGDT